MKRLQVVIPDSQNELEHLNNEDLEGESSIFNHKKTQPRIFPALGLCLMIHSFQNAINNALFFYDAEHFTCFRQVHKVQARL